MQLRDHAAVQSKRDYFTVDPRALKIDESYNVRSLTSPETLAHIEDLKASIAVNGVRVALEVRLDGEDIYIVAGHCRHAAVMELIAEGNDIKTVPAIKRDKEKAKPTSDAALDRLAKTQRESTPVHELTTSPEVLAECADEQAAIDAARAMTDQELVEGLEARGYHIIKDGGATQDQKEELVDHFNKWTPPSNALAAAHAVGSAAQLIEALEPFANLAHEHDFNERSDDDVIEVAFKHLKKAWIVFAKVTGALESEAA